MAFLNKEIPVRIGKAVFSARLSEEVYTKADTLLKLYPDKFKNRNHLIRVAIMRLYREYVEESVTKGILSARRIKPIEFE